MTVQQPHETLIKLNLTAAKSQKMGEYLRTDLAQVKDPHADSRSFFLVGLTARTNNLKESLTPALREHIELKGRDVDGHYVYMGFFPKKSIQQAVELFMRDENVVFMEDAHVFFRDISLSASNRINRDKLSLGLQVCGVFSLSHKGHDIYFTTNAGLDAGSKEFSSCPKLEDNSPVGGVYTYSMRGADIHDISMLSNDPKVVDIMDKFAYLNNISINSQRMPEFSVSDSLVTDFAVASYGNSRLRVWANQVFHSFTGSSFGKEVASESLATAAQQGFAQTLTEIYHGAQARIPVIWREMHHKKFVRNILSHLPELHDDTGITKVWIAKGLAVEWMNTVSTEPFEYSRRDGMGGLQSASSHLGFFLLRKDIA